MIKSADFLLSKNNYIVLPIRASQLNYQLVDYMADFLIIRSYLCFATYLCFKDLNSLLNRLISYHGIDIEILQFIEVLKW